MLVELSEKARAESRSPSVEALVESIRQPRHERAFPFCRCGTKVWRGRITGTGNTQLRTHFVESAWS
jgi:hypothetical protein